MSRLTACPTHAFERHVLVWNGLATRATIGWCRGSARNRTVHAKASSKTWESGCKLVGCGSSVPETVLTNQDMEKLVETNDEWIRSRTGIGYSSS